MEMHEAMIVSIPPAVGNAVFLCGRITELMFIVYHLQIQPEYSFTIENIMMKYNPNTLRGITYLALHVLRPKLEFL
jgi:hypothetical protein